MLFLSFVPSVLSVSSVVFRNLISKISKSLRGFGHYNARYQRPTIFQLPSLVNLSFQIEKHIGIRYKTSKIYRRLILHSSDLNHKPFSLSFSITSLFFSNSVILSSLRLILPLIVLGRSLTNSISLGYLYGAVICLTCC